MTDRKLSRREQFIKHSRNARELRDRDIASPGRLRPGAVLGVLEHSDQ